MKNQMLRTILFNQEDLSMRLLLKRLPKLVVLIPFAVEEKVCSNQNVLLKVDALQNYLVRFFVSQRKHLYFKKQRNICLIIQFSQMSHLTRRILKTRDSGRRSRIILKGAH